MTNDDRETVIEILSQFEDACEEYESKQARKAIDILSADKPTVPMAMLMHIAESPYTMTEKDVTELAVKYGYLVEDQS